MIKPLFAVSEGNCRITLHKTCDQLVARLEFEESFLRLFPERWRRARRSLSRGKGTLLLPTTLSGADRKVAVLWDLNKAAELQENAAKAVLARIATQAFMPLTRQAVAERLGIAPVELDQMRVAPSSYMLMRRHGKRYGIYAYRVRDVLELAGLCCLGEKMRPSPNR